MITPTRQLAGSGRRVKLRTTAARQDRCNVLRRQPAGPRGPERRCCSARYSRGGDTRSGLEIGPRPVIRQPPQPGAGGGHALGDADVASGARWPDGPHARCVEGGACTPAADRSCPLFGAAPGDRVPSAGQIRRPAHRCNNQRPSAAALSASLSVRSTARSAERRIAVGTRSGVKRWRIMSA